MGDCDPLLIAIDVFAAEVSRFRAQIATVKFQVEGKRPARIFITVNNRFAVLAHGGDKANVAAAFFLCAGIRAIPKGRAFINVHALHFGIDHFHDIALRQIIVNERGCRDDQEKDKNAFNPFHENVSLGVIGEIYQQADNR